MEKESNPAELVIGLFGASGVAEICHTDASTPYRWRYAKGKKGTGGTVPPKYHDQLLDAAKEKGLVLTRAQLLGLSTEETEHHTNGHSHGAIQ